MEQLTLGGHKSQAKPDMVKLKSSNLEIGFGEIQFSKLEKNKTLARCALCEQSTTV